MADFQTSRISGIFGVFSSVFFPQKTSNVLVEWFFACFWHFKFLTQNDHLAKSIAFAWAIAFARWPIFKLFAFLEYLVFFRAVFFALNISSVLLACFFACFWHLKFLTKTDHLAKSIGFAWAIAFARWPIFKIVSFLKYLVLFSRGILHRTNVMFC